MSRIKKIIKEKKETVPEVKPEIKEEVKMEEKKVEKLIVERFWPEFPHVWMQGIDMNTCIVCGKKDYYLYELVKIKGLQNMGLVCYDCLVKNSYRRIYKKTGWTWEKFEKKAQD